MTTENEAFQDAAAKGAANAAKATMPVCVTLRSRKRLNAATTATYDDSVAATKQSAANTVKIQELPQSNASATPSAGQAQTKPIGPQSTTAPIAQAPTPPSTNPNTWRQFVDPNKVIVDFQIKQACFPRGHRAFCAHIPMERIVYDNPTEPRQSCQFLPSWIEENLMDELCEIVVDHLYNCASDESAITDVKNFFDDARDNKRSIVKFDVRRRHNFRKHSQSSNSSRQPSTVPLPVLLQIYRNNSTLADILGQITNNITEDSQGTAYITVSFKGELIALLQHAFRDSFVEKVLEEYSVSSKRTPTRSSKSPVSPLQPVQTPFKTATLSPNATQTLTGQPQNDSPQKTDQPPADDPSQGVTDQHFDANNTGFGLCAGTSPSNKHSHGFRSNHGTQFGSSETPLVDVSISLQREQTALAKQIVMSPCIESTSLQLARYKQRQATIKVLHARQALVHRFGPPAPTKEHKLWCKQDKSVANLCKELVMNFCLPPMSSVPDTEIDPGPVESVLPIQVLLIQGVSQPFLLSPVFNSVPKLEIDPGPGPACFGLLSSTLSGLISITCGKVLDEEIDPGPFSLVGSQRARALLETWLKSLSLDFWIAG